MKLNDLTGWSTSLLIHGLLIFLIAPVLMSEEKPVEEAPELALDLNMFEPPKPKPAPVKPPEPQTQSEPEPEPESPKPAPEKMEPKPEPKPKPKLKPKLEPKKEKPKKVEKKIPKRDLKKEREKKRKQEELRQKREEQKRRERERLEQQRLEQQRLEQQRLEQQRLERQRQAEQRRQEELARQRAAAAAAPAVITNPRFRKPPSAPKYPKRALKSGIEGTAIVRANVAKNGRVKSARIHRSSGNTSLDKSAVSAVKRWVFVPASRNGQNIESIVQVPVRFKINQ